MCVPVTSWARNMLRGLALLEVEKIEINSRTGAGEKPADIANAVEGSKIMI